MKRILTRAVSILPAIFLEVLLIIILRTWLQPWAAVIEGLMRLVGALAVLFIISNRQEGAYKVLWLLFFSSFPLPAAYAYLLWGNKRTVKPITLRVAAAEKELTLPVQDGSAALARIAAEDERTAESLQYVTVLSGFAPALCESTEYYPLGEACWTAMLEEMKKAEKYIYLEYFIVEDGLMWGEMLKIMAERARVGVDVRFIYDDVGSLTTFSKKDTKKLDEAGIKWLAFNPLKYIRGTLNNRSHRKMLIIDGRVAFSGGINLADEYINKTEKYGHWKDIGFKITGPAAANYLHMFVQFWNAFSPDKIPGEVFPSPADCEPQSHDGIALSYYDSPGFRDPVSNNFYIEMLGNAKKYAWFYTPYLMLGDTLMDAFVRAAKRGVDVRIITPGVPDKKLVFRLTRSFYRPLLEAGAKIYQYTPGFVHAKASLYDDEVCTVGTVNLDYRSLYLHFENNTIFYRSSVIDKLKADYLQTLEKCARITKNDLKQGLFATIFDGILRIFAPLC